MPGQIRPGIPLVLCNQWLHSVQSRLFCIVSCVCVRAVGFSLSVLMCVCVESLR